MKSPAAFKNNPFTPPPVVLKLIVRNHPGTMSHITGLFSRRAFNMEGILCGPIGDGSQSRIFILVHPDGRLEQILHQVHKLYDVFDVTVLESFNAAAFTELDRLLTLEV